MKRRGAVARVRAGAGGAPSKGDRGPRPTPGAPRYRGARPRVVLVLLILLGIVLFYLARQPLLSGAGWALVASDPLEKTDVALVLGGDDSLDGNRVRTAVKLYKDGWVRRIALSGPRGAYGVHETDYSVPIAISQGVPRPDIIVLTHQSRSTEEELRYLAPILERRGMRSICLVTANFHTRRARRIMRAASGGRLRIVAYAAPPDWFDPDRWWQSREGRKVFVLESAKTVNTFFESLVGYIPRSIGN